MHKKKRFNLKSLICPGHLGQQLSTFLIEHSYAAVKNRHAPSLQDISKFKLDKADIYFYCIIQHNALWIWFSGLF